MTDPRVILAFLLQ